MYALIYMNNGNLFNSGSVELFKTKEEAKKTMLEEVYECYPPEECEDDEEYPYEITDDYAYNAWSPESREWHIKPVGMPSVDSTSQELIEQLM